MSVLLPILDTQAFALPPSHRIDNAHQPTPARTIYWVYRHAPRRRLGCHLPAVKVEFAKFVYHNDRRSKTSFSYIRPPAPITGLTMRWGKGKQKIRTAQAIRKKKFISKISNNPVVSSFAGPSPLLRPDL